MKNIHTIRRIVATMANRLKKIGLTLSAAFKKAWALIKGNPRCSMRLIWLSTCSALSNNA